VSGFRWPTKKRRSDCVYLVWHGKKDFNGVAAKEREKKGQCELIIGRKERGGKGGVLSSYL